VLIAAALVLAWLIAYPRTPDLAAATYRVNLFRAAGFLLVDERWYAGHDMPGYSLLFPALGALLGVRAVGALAVLASTALFGRLSHSLYGGAAAGWGTAFFAVAALGDVWAGRVAFALGVPFALAAVLALRSAHARWAVAAAVVCAAASPVAGVLLALGGLSVAVVERSPRALVALGAPAALVVLVLAALFGEGGFEPFPLLSFIAAAGVALAFLLALPRTAAARPLRVGGALYLGACVACVLVHTPMGSNVERYGVLLAGPLLACARLQRRGGARAQGLSAVSAAALLAIAVWVVWGPVRETLAVAGSAATSASYYAPLERFLAREEGGPVRVEVPLTRSHWEAALLARSVALARGWEKQLEERYDGALLARGLSAAAYERWLDSQAISYVALPDVALDGSSAAEGRLISAGLPFLREVFTSAHWRVYRVLGASALASGPGRITQLGHDHFALRAARAGSFLVRVHYTRYWSVSRGRGCVTRSAGGWTLVRAYSPGSLLISARFSLGAAVNASSSCTAGSAPRADAPPLGSKQYSPE